jgi:hypothetical protein
MAFAGVGPSNTAFGCTFGNCVPPHPNAGQNPGQFFGPGPLAVSSTGDVYVADAAGDIFLGASASGAFGLGCVSGGAANCPQAANFRIQVFTSSGAFFNSFGSFCSLSSTRGVVIDSNGDVIPGTAGGTLCDTSAPGASAAGDGEFAYVTGITLDNSSSNVYISDADNNRIQKLLPDGTFILKWGGLPTGSGDGQFNAPGGIATDLLDNSIYVVDVFNDRIQQFDGNGMFFSKGGSKGAFEAQFDEPVGIATVPGGVAAQCFFADATTSNLGALDCRHGFVVSEQGNQKRVQYLAARVDEDKDSITDEIDLDPLTFSNDFSNASLGLTTTGSILDRGDQTFAVYGVVSPSPQDLISVRTETFGGARPLQISICGTSATLLFSAGTGQDFHCSTPTVITEEGPVGFRFVGSDGTAATATLNTGDSLSVDPHTSKITSNAGTIVIVVGGKTVSLSPGKSAFADTTPPVVSCVSADGAWHALDVSIACTAADSGSGLANPVDANFALSTSVPAGTETANAATGTRLVCDLAGNCTTAGPIPGNMIDKKPPSITLSTPAATTYALNQAVAASYSCSDGGSGVATCAGPVANGANTDTATVGSKTFTVSSTDNVGNAAKQSVSYSVTYNICLLYDSSKSVKSGAAYPIKIALCDANGNDVSSSAVVVHAVNLTQASTGASATVQDTGNANPDNDFRFVGSSRYIFNLSTKGLAGTYTLKFTVASDPQQHSVPFQVHP